MTKLRSNATYQRQRLQRTLLQQDQAEHLETMQEQEAMRLARDKAKKPVQKLRQYR